MKNYISWLLRMDHVEAFMVVFLFLGTTCCWEADMWGGSRTPKVTPNLDFVTNFLCFTKSESCNSTSASCRVWEDWHFNRLMTWTHWLCVKCWKWSLSSVLGPSAVYFLSLLCEQCWIVTLHITYCCSWKLVLPLEDFSGRICRLLQGRVGAILMHRAG